MGKKIRDTKGTLHANMDTIKDRNGKDLTEAEEIKKRWQEYTEELYRKCLNDPDNQDGMVTHLEPNTLECEVKQALGSIAMKKTSDFLKKIGDIKGVFHARMGTIKDRNDKDLTEAEEIKKRWQEYTEELYKKIFMTQITTMV